MDTNTVIELAAELLKAAGETSVDAQHGPTEVATLLLDLDSQYSVCLSNASDTWGADIADLENHEIVGYIETRLAVDTTDAEMLASVFKVHLDLARLDLRPYQILRLTMPVNPASNSLAVPISDDSAYP